MVLESTATGSQWEFTRKRQLPLRERRVPFVRRKNREALEQRPCLSGQYRKYRDEAGVPPESETATFGAVKLYVDSWRWQGVPFFLRSGEAMSCQTTQVVIQFRRAPHMLFDLGPYTQHEANRLVLQVQPAEGIQLHFHTKVPDEGMKLPLTDLSFRFKAAGSGYSRINFSSCSAVSLLLRSAPSRRLSARSRLLACSSVMRSSMVPLVMRR